MEKMLLNNDTRKEWMALFSMADPKDLKSASDNLIYRFKHIVRPESGMIMVKGRADGSSSGFNLGEMTVSRCVVSVNKNYQGVSWIMGTDLNHAELAAILDGLMQDPEFNTELSATLLPFLKDKKENRQSMMMRETAETKVDFFTLKRGE